MNEYLEKMLRTFRQYRKCLLVLAGFLGSLFLVYHAGFSAGSYCNNENGVPCYKAQTNERYAENVKVSRRNIDSKARFIPVSKDLDVVINKAILKESNDNIQRKQRRIKAKEKKFYAEKNKQKMHHRKRFGRKSKLQGKLFVSSTKSPLTLSHLIRNHKVRNVYIQLKEADSPRTGDFDCDATIVPNCCAFSVGDTHEAKRICEGFGELCKGFVMSTISLKHDTFEYVMYLKKELNGTMANYLTDFFVKVDFLDELKWKDKMR